MAGLKTRSIFFRSTIVYVFLTLLNVSIFILMIFENQLDLIAENAVLNAQHTASSLKYRIDNIIGTAGQMSTSNINMVLKEASMFEVNRISLFSEAGKIYVDVQDNTITERTDADLEELRMINMAITRQGFEDKLFYHSVNKDDKSIQLYIPFMYQRDHIGVAAIELEMKDIDRQMGYLYRQCIIVGLLVTVLHIGFAFLFTKMFLLPLRKLNEATKQISKGDLNIRVPISGSDEFGQLASSFNEMSVSLARMRDEAKGSNPLTGLPGNITIASYIDEKLAAGNYICVLYCDLDNFKAYNDKYGFTKGDEAIMYTKDSLLQVAKRKDFRDVFVGHEGGDDFVMICPFEYWESIAKSFITTFDRGIYQFYNSVDARNGYIESVNRLGERQRFPLMSVSVAVVTNKTRPFRRHAEMIQVATEVKKFVKSMDGSCYAIDRRTGPTSPTQIIRREPLSSQKPERRQ